MGKEILSKPEIAEYFGVSIGTINNMMRDGLPHIKTGEAKSCKVLFPVRLVDQWIEDQIKKTTSPALKPGRKARKARNG